MDAPHEAHLRRILNDFSADARAKYEAGQREHGGNLWEKPRILDNAIEEAIDQVVYLYTLKEQQRQAATPGLKVIYVAGPFRGPNSWEIEENIRRAERLSLDVWKLGAAAICPHTNTRFFQGAAADNIWLEGDLAILAKCDGILMTPDWQRSSGATAELRFAEARGIPVFLTLEDLAFWLNRVETVETEKIPA